ncbi:hypothetical protein V493_03185 [Pseudogymnoascus sp. VKM F-4281 (FW-2241)]|nr:hypothetical protein V493_03185 [Pseudogymnoascus sp. VKM F-4281 (FW-2241)]
MQPLNPFLSAFFRGTFPAQCTPAHHHVLLVPTTEVLLTSRDRETGALFSDLAQTEDFLGSHVLRIPNGNGATPGGKETTSMREHRGKAKQYTTINGRTVIIKDAFVYANKGFKTLNQAQLLYDSLWYPDSLEPRSWLIYYISKPLIGTVVGLKDENAVSKPDSNGIPRTVPSTMDSHSGPVNTAVPRKRDIKSFNDLLSSFPMIARQMQPGLERLFKEFNHVFDKPLPPPPSANHIPDPDPEGPIATVVKNVRSGSVALGSQQENGHLERVITGSSFLDDEEQIMRGALETAVTAAIDIFQMVDKQQLSLLGATTDLTGPIVERLIERYVAEQLHGEILYPRICALKRPEDLELESKIKQMEFIDISQVGIPIQGGNAGKHELTLRLGRAVEEFRKLSVAGSPQQMMDILLLTLRTVTLFSDVPNGGPSDNPHSEKVSPILTINADTLVSLLLVVVIRSQVRNLQARLLYMRHFIYIDDVENGEMGYALSTLEAVLLYLQRDSGSLRKASRRNKKLWQSASNGDLQELQKIMEPERCDSPADYEADQQDALEPWNFTNGIRNGVAQSPTFQSRRLSQISPLGHVFPFQNQENNDNTPPNNEDLPPTPPPRRPKTVTMDMRSMSTSSEISFRSRATTIDSMGSGIEGDTSIERLSQTEDLQGESVLMMAVNNRRPESLRYLLSLEEYYSVPAVLADANIEGTTLFSAAVQLGNKEIIDILLETMSRVDETTRISYLARQDIRGRSAGHYLFNTHWLIPHIGRLIPWRQKDKNGQTPLFALCRSYDHNDYSEMVESGLIAATAAQGDGLPLHVDDHVDSKGNTLLHIVNGPHIALRILLRSDANVNATNEKKFTPLMVASKYGRLEMVRVLFGDPRVDIYARELRGLTAVELAKDDEVRNRIDDLVLFSGQPGEDGRITTVVRSFFVEDATIRLVLKSGAPSHDTSFTVTTCRRSLTDFEHLAKLLAIENPASWLPIISGMRSPFQIPSKPSRAVLRDIQVRLDGFLKILLSHSTFSTHEMLWEFFLVPDIQGDMMEKRSRLKAEARVDRLKEEYEPVQDVKDVEQFVDHARDMVRSVNYATKSVVRRTNALRTVMLDLADAGEIASKNLQPLGFIPTTHKQALEAYLDTLTPPTIHPIGALHSTLSSLHSTLIAILLSLSRPTSLISSITASSRSLQRNYASLSRSTRWPLGLLDDTRQRLDREKQDVIHREEEERDGLGRELREGSSGGDGSGGEGETEGDDEGGEEGGG